MTGPYDDGPSGLFDHLDDPGAPAPSGDVLSSVVHRGRRIRARRQGIFAATGAVAVSAAVLAGLGISHAVDASRSNDTVVPAGTPTPFASASAPSRHHPKPGVAVVVPGAGPVTSPASPSPSAGPCESSAPSPSATPGAIWGGPIVQSSVPPLFPTASPDPCATASGSPSPSPSESPTPEPSTTGEPTSSP